VARQPHVAARHRHRVSAVLLIPRNSVFVAEPRYGVPFVPFSPSAQLRSSCGSAGRVAYHCLLALAALVTALSLQRVIDASEKTAVQATCCGRSRRSRVQAIEERDLRATYATIGWRIDWCSKTAAMCSSSRWPTTTTASAASINKVPTPRSSTATRAARGWLEV